MNPIEQEQLLVVLTRLSKMTGFDCRNLPISGGWGYSEDTAIKFEGKMIEFPYNFISDEYLVAEEILDMDVIALQANEGYFSFSDTLWNRNFTKQVLTNKNGRQYDILEFGVTCLCHWHWNKLEGKWEKTNGEEQTMIVYHRSFWFDITEVFGRNDGVLFVGEIGNKQK